ncbi:MAG: ribonuclease Z [Bacteroidia bacterium]
MEHTIILKDTKADAAAFLAQVTEVYPLHKDKNLVVDLSHEDGLALENLLAYLPLSNAHRKAKKSFVLVVKDFDFDDDENPEELIIVPTLQEAHDIIEMEEIERDLGF